jgi:hypothetical protein
VEQRIEDEWKGHFVAYENALASFYALQDATQTTLEQSYTMRASREQLASLRESVLESRRRLRSSAVDGRVTEIERQRATVEIDGVPFDVMDLVANRAGQGDTLLELSFRVDPRSIPHFVKLTEAIRIRFPFGESSYIAACRLVRFRMVQDEFAFRFATVDPA